MKTQLGSQHKLAHALIRTSRKNWFLLVLTIVGVVAVIIMLTSGQGQVSMPPVPICGEYPGVEEKPFQKLDFDQLDYGVYWFGHDNRCQKAVPGYPNPYFDPNRPTVLYIHGWEANTVAAHFRESFYLTPGYPGIPSHLNTANPWLDAGWNVGIFYWNQFSDETSPDLAEGKIWAADGSAGIRWRKYSGGFMPGPSLSVGELFYQSYVDALGGGQARHPQVRLVGHSLGSQLAIYGAELIAERRPDLLPARIALLDPHFSLGAQPYLVGGPGGDMVGERARNYVDHLESKGVLFEQYQTTIGGDLSFAFPGLGGNDANPGLKLKTAFARLHFDYVPLLQLQFPWVDLTTWFRDQHIAAIGWYFRSFANAEIGQCIASGSSRANGSAVPGPSARSTDDSIRALMRREYAYEQAGGTDSADPGKACYQQVKR